MSMTDQTNVVVMQDDWECHRNRIRFSELND